MLQYVFGRLYLSTECARTVMLFVNLFLVSSELCIYVPSSNSACICFKIQWRLWVLYDCTISYLQHYFNGRNTRTNSECKTLCQIQVLGSCVYNQINSSCYFNSILQPTCNTAFRNWALNETLTMEWIFSVSIALNTLSFPGFVFSQPVSRLSNCNLVQRPSILVLEWPSIETNRQ